MDRDFFLNSGLHFEPSSQMQSWKLMSPLPEMNCLPEQSQIDRFATFDSTLNSLVSSPASSSAAPNDSFTVREFIGKLGNNGNAGDVSSPNTLAQAAASSVRYNTPLSSPSPKLDWPIVDKLGMETRANLRNSIPFGHNLPSLAADPGFAERAAKFSCFGSRSFNGRTTQMGLNSNNRDMQHRSSVSPLMKAKMPRVSSSPSLNIDGSANGIHGINNSVGTHMDDKTTSNDESSVSEQMDVKLKNMNDTNSRKRKAAALKGKAKEIASGFVKEEEDKDLDSKKVKKTEDIGNGETEKKSTALEPPKDYIHVRARRGQATDSHSLAERVRREKISERMKLLQDLVPGCNKVTGKALMLDEIINYVQSLQHQVEFLSMKLATVNPRQDLDMNSHISKNTNQLNVNLTQQLYTSESSTSDFYQQQNPQVLFTGSTPITHSSVGPVHGFTEAFSQFAGFEGDDLHSIVKMGYGDNRNQPSEMKIEL